MNKFNLATINAFREKSNIMHLKNVLSNTFNDPSVYAFINANICYLVENFIYQVNEDFKYSDQVLPYEPKVQEQNACLNAKFVDYAIKFIRDNFLQFKPIDRMAFAITDGLPYSSKTIVSRQPRAVICDENSARVKYVNEDCAPDQGSADKILESWRYAYRGATERDDKVGDLVAYKDHRGYASNRLSINPKDVSGQSRYYGKDSHYSRQKYQNCGECLMRVGGAATVTYGGESYQGGVDNENGLTSGYFDETCDNPNGTANHLDQLLGDPYVRHLNDGNALGNKLWADGHQVIDETKPGEKERMLAQRRFRRYPRAKCFGYPTPYNEPQDSCPADLSNIWTGEILNNQTPNHERWLYNRHYERDVDEAVGGFEWDGLNRGYDMSSLYCRIDCDPNSNYGFVFDEYCDC